MLGQLTLQNFGTHRALSVTFTQGLNAIKGANEAGKSTLMTAIWYALYGSSALPSTVDELVTWGCSPSSLKVSLSFSFGGVQDFVVTRTKSSASLISRESGLSVQGHSAVNAHIESLFGVSAKIAGQLYGASQGDLKGTLSGVSGVSTALLEKLAKFSELDDMIQAIRDKLPTGHTKGLEDTLTTLREVQKPDEPVLIDTSVEIEELETVLDSVKREKAVNNEIDRLVDLLETTTLEHRRSSQKLERLLAADAELSTYPVELCEARWALSEATLRAATEVFEESGRTLRAFKAFFSTGASVRQVSKSNASAAEKYVRVCKQELDALVGRKVELASSIKQVSTRLCVNCQAALETGIAEHNARVEAEIAEVSCRIELAKAKHAEAQARHTEEAAMYTAWLAYTPVAQDLEAVAVLSESLGGKFVQATTTLDELKAKHDRVSEEYMLVKARAQKDQERLQSAKALEKLLANNALNESQTLVGNLQRKMVETDMALRALEATRGGNLVDVEAKAKVLRDKISSAEAVNTARTNLYNQRLSEYKAYISTAATLRKSIAETKENNVIIKKLQEARPHLSATLWAAVLSEVSETFSLMRGSVCVVSYDGQFCVDGRNAKSLSESTKDILGLALRIALVRMFLPSVTWLLLDEPASACDTEREAAMVGAIAACGFDQVLMISHSSVPDAVADNIVSV